MSSCMFDQMVKTQLVNHREADTIRLAIITFSLCPEAHEQGNELLMISISRRADVVPESGVGAGCLLSLCLPFR